MQLITKQANGSWELFANTYTKLVEEMRLCHSQNIAPDICNLAQIECSVVATCHKSVGNMNKGWICYLFKYCKCFIVDCGYMDSGRESYIQISELSREFSVYVFGK